MFLYVKQCCEGFKMKPSTDAQLGSTSGKYVDGYFGKCLNLTN